MATPSSSAASDAGHTIGPYTLTREIGKGSFAVVFLGKNRSPETSSNTENGTTKVAIKIVTRKKLTAKLLENLEGEINILRTVRHANIVELIDCLKTSSHIYLIMEYCKMGDLSMYIRSRRRNSSKDGDRRISLFEAQADAQYPHPPDGGLNADVTRSFLSQLASALQFMRDKNIVHRDIKPQNLLLQEPEADLVASGHPTLIPQIKVADFGFARHLDVASLAETLCGSPLYMAPEILKHQKYDAKTDLWSVGAVLYEMCVGRPPFRAANHIELLKRIERAEDKIKFPDEKSEDSLRREQMRRTEGCRDGEEVLRPHTVDGDLKALIRTLLKQKPVERMSFESFFACSITESTRTHSMKSSAASLSNSLTPVATRPAPAIPTSVQTNNNDDTRRTSRASPEGAPATSRNHFKSKYVVGGRQVTPRTPRREREEANKGASRDEHVGEAGEASSLEDNVLETPGSSVTNLPATAEPGPTLVAAIGTKSAASPTRGQAQRATVLDEDDKGYVMVEKKSVEVNSLADEMADANLAKTANEQRGPWGALGRRPSRLSRLASGLGAATVKAVAAGPSSPSTSPSSPQQSPSTQRSNALFEIGVDARHAAPFAIPSSARRPSFNRRRSQASDQQRPSAFPRQQSMPDQSQATALVPSSAPTVLNVGGGAGGGSSPISYASPSQAMGLASASSSGLARAISMASIRLFGVPTGMSLKSATARRSLRLGLGAGGLFSSSPGNATEFQTGDAAEQNLLNLLQDYGRKSFVLSEFADARLSLFYSDGPHQGNYYDSGRSSSTSSVNLITAGRTGIGTGSASHGANSTSLSSEVVAAEALVLYVKSLSFLQRGIDATKDYIEARSARYASPFTTGVEVNEVVQWLRAKFNDGYERANFARSKASEEMPESAQNVDKMIFDKALEIARGAALEELGSNRAVNDLSWNAEKCLLAYETASNMLMALLDPGEEAMELSESSVGTIEKFVKSIHKRMASLQRQSDGVALAS